MANVSSSNGLEKCPKLRFPGFDEPWKLRKLNDMLNQRIEKQIPSVDAPLMAFTAEGGVEPKGERYDRSYLVKNEDKLYKRTEYNDFIYSSNNLDVGSIGLNRYGTAVISDVYEIFSVKSDYLPTFVSELIQRPQNMKKVLKYRQGCLYGQYRIYAEDFLSVPVFVPTKQEQEKISQFLDSLDKRIAYQRSLINNLKKYKRGVMKSIFRDKTILFSKTTKWKSVCLGDECTFFSGGTPKSTDSSFYGGTIPFIRSGEIHNENTALFLTDDGLKYSSAKMVSKGDLIFALYGATSGEVDISKIDGAINQAILCIRPTQINRTFLKYLLEDRKDDILNTYLQGGQGNLSAEIIKNLVFDVPDDQSQLKAVDFLSLIDERINSSLKCIEALTELYSGFMQQLFI